MYLYEVKPELEKSLKKLVNKDKKQYESVVKKISFLDFEHHDDAYR